MNEYNTFDSIMEALENLSIEKNPVDPQTWLSGALKLNVLLEGEIERLIGMEFDLACMRKKFLEEANTATYAKMMIEATPEYMEVQKLKAKIKNAEQTILLCKKYATLTSDLMRQNM